MGPGLTWNFVVVWNITPKSSYTNMIFWASTSSTMCMLCVNTLLKVVSYYYLNVLSMSVMGFQKSSDRGGWMG